MPARNINKNYLLIPLLIVTLSGCGKEQGDASQAQAIEAVSAAADKNYVTSGSLTVAAEGDKAASVVLPAGSAVTVLETREDAQRGTMVRLGVDSDDESLPSEVWVPKSEIDRAGLVRLEDPAAAESAADDEGMGADARRGMTYCYRYVKLYLLKIGKVSSYLPGGSAWMAAATLPKHGFRRTSGGPGSAQLNDVCVYRGGSHGHGHIEVKVSGGWYYGYGVKPQPISNRQFIGCFRK